MNLIKYLGVAMVMGLGLAPSVSHAYGRQYYGGWSSYSSYYYRPYYYKPYNSYYGYKTNYVVYYPSSPNYYYYYSPYSRQYWGRCPINTKGEGLYSFLTPDARPKPGPIANVAPDAKFPEATTPPPIPQTAEEKKLDPNPPQLDLPPDDLPPKVSGIPVGTVKDEGKGEKKE
jgi:hypothetical protein